MSQVHSIACGFPFCQNSQSKQTNLSIGLRVTVIAVGTIVAIGGILMLCGTPGISQLGHTVAWVAISTGGTLVLIGVSIKCVEYEIDKNADLQTSRDSITPEQTRRKEKLLNTADESDLSEGRISEDIYISEETVVKIQSSMANVLKREEDGGVKLYSSQHSHRVFALDAAPDFIFKMAPGSNQSIRQRYQRMINAHAVCRTHKLGLLIIPKAKLFTVKVEGKDYDIIAEQKLDINPNESAQEQYYEDYADSLDEAIRQLAIFICKTGYSDVERRNNPILNNSIDEHGNRKFALIDIEEIDSPEIGLFGGGWGRRGLVRCINEQQGQIVREVARKNGIKTSSFANAHALRKEELEDGKKLKQYYSTTHIERGDEPVVVDIDSIDFSPYSPEKVEKLRKLAVDLLDAINEKTANSSPEESIKGRRHIYIDVNHDERFLRMNNKLIIEKSEEGYKRANSDEECHNATYLGFVANKFVQMGLIYKVITRNDHGYFIQA